MKYGMRRLHIEEPIFGHHVFHHLLETRPAAAAAAWSAQIPGPAAANPAAAKTTATSAPEYLEVVDDDEAAFQHVVAQCLRFTVGNGPPVRFDDVRDGISE